MPLNIQSGESKPYVKYNAKADKWFVKKEGADQEEEIARPTFIADFDNIKTGWFLFMEGQAPNIVYDSNLTTPAAKPSEHHKRGFEVMLYSQQAFGGAVVMTGASMHICNAINEAYEVYEKDRDTNKGMLPVVQCTGSTPQKDKFGTNYRPSFSIVKWVARPDALGGSAKAETTAPAQQQPAPAAVGEF